MVKSFKVENYKYFKNHNLIFNTPWPQRGDIMLKVNENFVNDEHGRIKYTKERRKILKKYKKNDEFFHEYFDWYFKDVKSDDSVKLHKNMINVLNDNDELSTFFSECSCRTSKMRNGVKKKKNKLSTKTNKKLRKVRPIELVGSIFTIYKTQNVDVISDFTETHAEFINEFYQLSTSKGRHRLLRKYNNMTNDGKYFKSSLSDQQLQDMWYKETIGENVEKITNDLSTMKFVDFIIFLYYNKITEPFSGLSRRGIASVRSEGSNWTYLTNLVKLTKLNTMINGDKYITKLDNYFNMSVIDFLKDLCQNNTTDFDKNICVPAKEATLPESKKPYNNKGQTSNAFNALCQYFTLHKLVDFVPNERRRSRSLSSIAYLSDHSLPISSESSSESPSESDEIHSDISFDICIKKKDVVKDVVKDIVEDIVEDIVSKDIIKDVVEDTDEDVVIEKVVKNVIEDMVVEDVDKDKQFDQAISNGIEKGLELILKKLSNKKRKASFNLEKLESKIVTL
jgi:hypothetical protein